MGSASGSIVRPLTAGDLDRVIAIDAGRGGGARRHFFHKRFAAAAARPADFIHLGVTQGGAVQGFAIARIVRGEFGQADAVAVLDSLGVDTGHRGQGLGRALIAELCRLAGERGAGSVQSQVSWNDPGLLRFFNAARFELAPRIALERPVTELAENVEVEP